MCSNYTKGKQRLHLVFPEETQIARDLQLITSSSQSNFKTEELTSTPSTQLALSTSNITVLSPFPTTKIFFPTATSRQGGRTRCSENLRRPIHALVSFCHIINLTPEFWSSTYKTPSTTTAGPHQHDTSASAGCHVRLEGLYTRAFTWEDAAEL